MADIPTPQEPDDSREVVRGVDADGKFVFRQVGFEELNFGAVFGGKTTSTTENAIGYGLKTFTLDVDDGKILVGHTVQITSLDDVDCFMYGVVLRKEMAATPATIVVSIHTVSDTALTGSNWEIQIVEVSREATLEVRDEDVVLEDHHKVVFYTTPLTAPRTLTLSSGETLIPGARLLVLDAADGAFTEASSLSITPAGQVLDTAGEHVEDAWSGSGWSGFNVRGYFWSREPDSSPLTVEEFDDRAFGGPNINIIKNSATPATGDALGAIQFLARTTPTLIGSTARLARRLGLPPPATSMVISISSPCVPAF